jgi:hypothetical protein
VKREPTFKTEVELCAAFIAWAKEAGWVAYAETEGWDILLVGPDDVQIGVQAKLAFNLKVLAQALPDRWAYQWHEHGPDFRAILVPDQTGPCETICGAVGLTVFRPHVTETYRAGRIIEFIPELGRNRYYRSGEREWHWWGPIKRHKLPAYVPDVAAGASAPMQLTEWKIKALKVCALLEIRGKRWTAPDGWLLATDQPGVYERGPALDFDRHHPEVYAQVLADVRADTNLLGLV